MHAVEKRCLHNPRIDQLTHKCTFIHSCLVDLNTVCRCNNNNNNNNNIDVAILSDRNVVQKESEKKLKYKNISIEIQRMWNMKCFVIPVIIGATGIVTRGLKKYMEFDRFSTKTAVLEHHTLYVKCYNQKLEA
jgi:hypothetical protein